MIQHILVAVDFDATSEHALDYALALAQRTGARVTVMHVYGLPVLNALDAEYVPSASRAVDLTDEAQRKFDALLAPRKARGVAMTSELRVGSPAEEICSHAREIGADLIVVGKHKRGVLGRVLLGSVAQSVLRDAPVPVLTVVATPAAE